MNLGDVRDDQLLATGIQVPQPAQVPSTGSGA
jgi:hypothetical protein